MKKKDLQKYCLKCTLWGIDFPRVINTANYMNTNVTKYRDTGTFQGAGS